MGGEKVLQEEANGPKNESNIRIIKFGQTYILVGESEKKAFDWAVIIQCAIENATNEGSNLLYILI